MATHFSYAVLSADQQTLGSIKTWAQHADIDVDQVLELSQQYLFARLRVREMVMSTSISLAIGDSTAPLPAGFQGPLSFKIDGDYHDLDYVQEGLLQRYWDNSVTPSVLDTGHPERWTIFDELMQFNVQCDMAYTGRLVYYGTPVAISSTNDTNFLSTRYANVLEQTLLAFAYKARKRPETAAEMQLAENYIMEANRLADTDRRGQWMR